MAPCPFENLGRTLNSFKYLGSTIEATGGCGADVDNRVRSAWNSWRGLSRVICDKKVPVKLKNKLYKTVIRLWYMAVSVGRYTEQQRMHTTEMKMLRWIQGKIRKDGIRNEKFGSDANYGQANHHICHPETPFVVWPCDEKRRHECCKASNNDEGGREESSRKAQTEVVPWTWCRAISNNTSSTQSWHRTEKDGERQSWRSTPDRDKIGKGTHYSISYCNQTKADTLILGLR